MVGVDRLPRGAVGESGVLGGVPLQLLIFSTTDPS
jgi:hypothetical protein